MIIKRKTNKSLKKGQYRFTKSMTVIFKELITVIEKEEKKRKEMKIKKGSG